MTRPFDSTDLTGKFLIAMPGMGDPRFERSVVFLCAHSDNGAMGLVVNKPLPDLTFGKLLKQLKIEPGQNCADVNVQFGGPVENGRGFVLHSADYYSDGSTLRVNDLFGMTATLEVLGDLATGAGPAQALLTLGYAGWGPRQLENEIARNGWLTCDATAELVFSADNGRKWERALKSLGVDPFSLSPAAGRA